MIKDSLAKSLIVIVVSPQNKDSAIFGLPNYHEKLPYFLYRNPTWLHWAKEFCPANAFRINASQRNKNYFQERP